jgi:protein ImuA
MHSSTSTVRASSDLDNVLAKTQVWRAGELGGANLHTVSTGYEALDKILPGGGWPQGALVELLLPQAGQHEWGLLAPGLVHALNQPATFDEPGAQLTALVGPPYLPFGPALGARQIDMRRLISIHGKSGNAASLLWATREALQCADVTAVLAWLPDARSAHLRRLQIAAHTHHKLLFVFRPLRAQNESSPAPLRLLLEGAVEEGGNLRVHVIKRSGPPLAVPLLLNTRAMRLEALLSASRDRRRQQDEVAPSFQPKVIDLSDLLRRPLHALDRTASLDPH